MSSSAALRLPEPLAQAAVVVAARAVAGHDGAAELLIDLRYENGVLGHVTLDAATGFELMAAAGAASFDALVGRPWREITKGL